MFRQRLAAIELDGEGRGQKGAAYIPSCLCPAYSGQGGKERAEHWVAAASLGAALNPETVRHYRGTARSFLTYLGATYPTSVRSRNSAAIPTFSGGWLVDAPRRRH